MIKPELLKILVCPESHQDLELAPQALVDRINALIPQGKVVNRAGKAVTEKIDGGLTRKDGKYVYPVRGSIPILLIDEAIPVSSF
ncbi:MAG: hypothetical protein Q8Q08_02225 [Candidatus Omnitrophota bacterium]|nr:hypothetical protein [Candidatus Omnitrophota bacterium]MDZ4241845.1 hypothetical protein [Candidatus Omnitrophota bacterium]